MQRSYQISKGHQYSGDGVLVIRGRLYSCYDAEGQLEHGSPVAVEDQDQVIAAVRRVAASDIEETIEIGQPDPATAEDKAWLTGHDRLMADMDRDDSDL